MPNDVIIEFVTSHDEFFRLENVWGNLLKKTDVDSPFLTHGWLRAWLTTYGTGSDILLLLAKFREEVVGILPFVITKRYGFRILELIGSYRSDWLDLPIMPQFRENALRAALSALLNEKIKWDIINFRDILEDSPLLYKLESITQDFPMLFRKKVRTEAPFLPINSTWEEYCKTRSNRFAQKLRNQKKKLYETLPAFRIEKVLNINDENSIIDSMESVEANSWKATSGNPKLTTRIGKEFYRRICKYFSDLGCLEIWTATSNDKMIAFALNFIYQNKYYDYNTTFDQRFHKLSPGTILNAEAVKSSFGSGAYEYDFLSGKEAYKDRWCDKSRKIYQVVLFKQSISSFLAFFVSIKVRWILKQYPVFVKLNEKFVLLKRRFIRNVR